MGLISCIKKTWSESRFSQDESEKSGSATLSKLISNKAEALFEPSLSELLKLLICKKYIH